MRKALVINDDDSCQYLKMNVIISGQIFSSEQQMIVVQDLPTYLSTNIDFLEEKYNLLFYQDETDKKITTIIPEII